MDSFCVEVPQCLRPAAAPERLSAWTGAHATVVLHWFDAAGNESGYKVERSVNGRGNTHCTETREVGMW
jgi:hypothetical protein